MPSSKNSWDWSNWDTEACCGGKSKTACSSPNAEEPEALKRSSSSFGRALSQQPEGEHSSPRRNSGRMFLPSLLSKESIGTEASEDANAATKQSEQEEEQQQQRRRKLAIALALCVCIGAIFGIGLLVGGLILRDKENTRSADDPSVSSANDGDIILEITATPPPADSSKENEVFVGAYYYPWHGQSFHTGSDYLRAQLDPPQSPTLGEYDDSQPEVIQQHLDWSRQANIGLWITSWRGPDSPTDTTTRSAILGYEGLGGMKVAVHYETAGRVTDDVNLQNIQPDLEHICDKYFSSPNYYRVDGGRPVVFVNVSRKLERLGLLENAVLAMRSTASKCGENVFLVGDHIFRDAPDEAVSEQDVDMISSFVYFDAITNYDVYGSIGTTIYATEEDVKVYYDEQKDWKKLAAEEGCRYIPAVTPGFNDRGARPELQRNPLSRQLLMDREPGSFFSYSLDQARALVDSEIDNLIVVNSFNQWHEDTQIEPCTGGEAGTQTPASVTGGLEYTAYGELYLEILYDKTIPPLGQWEGVGDNIFKNLKELREDLDEVDLNN